MACARRCASRTSLPLAVADAHSGRDVHLGGGWLVRGATRRKPAPSPWLLRMVSSSRPDVGGSSASVSECCWGLLAPTWRRAQATHAWWWHKVPLYDLGWTGNLWQQLSQPVRKIGIVGWCSLLQHMGLCALCVELCVCVSGDMGGARSSLVPNTKCWGHACSLTLLDGFCAHTLLFAVQPDPEPSCRAVQVLLAASPPRRPRHHTCMVLLARQLGWTLLVTHRVCGW